MARRKRVAGLIVNGAVQDIDTITGWDDFPVLCARQRGQGPAIERAWPGQRHRLRRRRGKAWRHHTWRR
ncbi:hypothetical protein FJ957_01295 [Mesorhizobium sp. B2-4-6]|nr:hypothetical protein FJ957_01295 [Mesorhizobium sp. B2-4-6]